MNSNRTELFAAWIVALALIAVMGVHAFLPETPPRLGLGVTDASQPRPILEREPRAADFDFPLIDLGDPLVPLPDKRSFAEPEHWDDLPDGPGSLTNSGAGA